MLAPPCAASQDAEMPARTWVPLCSEWGPRGVVGQAQGRENRLLPAPCFVMLGPQSCLRRKDSNDIPKRQQGTLIRWGGCEGHWTP